MADLYETVKAPNRYFTIKDLYWAACDQGCENVQVRISSASFPESCPVKSFHLGSCGDYLAVYLNLGEPGEAKD